MKLREAIERADEVKPNAFTEKRKTEWLQELDGRIAADVFLLSKPELDQIRYSWPEDGDTELLVDPPHDAMYTVYLMAMIDFYNGEYQRYQNTSAMYSAMYSDFVTWFARTYDPAQGYRRKFRLLTEDEEG